MASGRGTDPFFVRGDKVYEDINSMRCHPWYFMAGLKSALEDWDDDIYQGALGLALDADSKGYKFFRALKPGADATHKLFVNGRTDEPLNDLGDGNTLVARIESSDGERVATGPDFGRWKHPSNDEDALKELKERVLEFLN